MPRNLPWLKTSTGVHETRLSTTGDTRTQRRGKSLSKALANTSVRGLEQTSRTPSTSPPPCPPAVDFMRPGDDDWIMVEDELLSTAQLFTKHLHYAEYERLKRIAMERGEATRHPVQRPTNPSGTSEIASVRELLRMGADEEHNSSDESAEVTMCDRNLAHLLRGEEARTARSSIAPVTRRNLDSMNRVAADYQGKASTNYSDAPSIKLAKRSGLLSRQDSRGQAGREAKPRGQARQLVHDGSDVVTSAAQDSGGRQASKEARMIAARSEQCNEPAIVPRESSRQDAPHSEQRSSLVNWRKSRVAKRKQQTMPDDEIPMFLG